MKKVLFLLFCTLNLFASLPMGTEKIRYTFYDKERNKEVVATLWENGKGKFPLIVLSHGYAGRPESLTWLIEKLLLSGYAVLGVQHDDVYPNGHGKITLWDRPLDITFALRKILLRAPELDPNRIGLIGYSLGGMTGVWLGGARANQFDEPIYPEGHANFEFPRDKSAFDANLDLKKAMADYRNDRIKAIAIMAPAWAWVFDKKGLSEVEVPVLILAGEKDEVITTKYNAEKFNELIPKAKLRTYPNAGHYAFIDGDDPEHLHTLFAAEIIAFFDQNLSPHSNAGH